MIIYTTSVLWVSKHVRNVTAQRFTNRSAVKKRVKDEEEKISHAVKAIHEGLNTEGQRTGFKARTDNGEINEDACEKIRVKASKERKELYRHIQEAEEAENRVFETMDKLPKIGEIKAVLHRHFEGELKTATVSKTCKGDYYISILVENNAELPAKQPFTEVTTIGVDVGIKDFAVLSTGEKIENPKYLKNSLKRLKVLQKRVSRKQKGSKNREKAKQRLAVLHDKITNQRKDFQNKLSFRLVSENQAIALETLNVKGMVKNHHLAQAISDSAWSGFVTKLEYKAEWYGKTILRIGRFEPSSKLCNVCGFHNSELTLKDREWTCPDCKTKHDRDINAAINIKKFALIDQNLIGV